MNPEAFLMLAADHPASVDREARAFDHQTDIVWCPAVVSRGVEGFAQLENRKTKSGRGSGQLPDQLVLDRDSSHVKVSIDVPVTASF